VLLPPHYLFPPPRPLVPYLFLRFPTGPSSNQHPISRPRCPPTTRSNLIDKCSPDRSTSGPLPHLFTPGWLFFLTCCSRRSMAPPGAHPLADQRFLPCPHPSYVFPAATSHPLCFAPGLPPPCPGVVVPFLDHLLPSPTASRSYCRRLFPPALPPGLISLPALLYDPAPGHLPRPLTILLPHSPTARRQTSFVLLRETGSQANRMLGHPPAHPASYFIFAPELQHPSRYPATLSHFHRWSSFRLPPWPTPLDLLVLSGPTAGLGHAVPPRCSLDPSRQTPTAATLACSTFCGTLPQRPFR